MGKLLVYFPYENRWKAIAPIWAKEKWEEYLEACQIWCIECKIPLSIIGDAHFYEK